MGQMLVLGAAAAGTANGTHCDKPKGDKPKGKYETKKETKKQRGPPTRFVMALSLWQCLFSCFATDALKAYVKGKWGAESRLLFFFIFFE